MKTLSSNQMIDFNGGRNIAKCAFGVATFTLGAAGIIATCIELGPLVPYLLSSFSYVSGVKTSLQYC